MQRILDDTLMDEIIFYVVRKFQEIHVCVTYFVGWSDFFYVKKNRCKIMLQLKIKTIPFFHLSFRSGNYQYLLVFI